MESWINILLLSIVENGGISRLVWCLLLWIACSKEEMGKIRALAP